MSEVKIKQQRDRFLAFSYACADLFIEVGLDDNIVFANGASRSLTGIDEKDIIGKKWFTLFEPSDRIKLSAMKANARMAKRAKPMLVHLDPLIGGGREVIVTGIMMPTQDGFYMTVGFTNDLMSQYADVPIISDDDRELMDKDSFITAAKEAMSLAKSLGQNIDLTLIDIENARAVKSKLTAEVWDDFSEKMTSLLNSYSIDGQAAAEIMEGRYSLVHDSNLDRDELQAQVIALARALDPGIEVQSKSVTADLSEISDRDTTKALIYTINEFERKGVSLNIESLNSGFKAYVSANAQKIVQFKSMVETLNFDLHFQPIVNMKDKELSHFEMLSRFNDNGSTHEWIAFGEDIGMAADFDIAVCERAMNYLLYKSSGRRTKFAINLSGQSIQNEQFFRTLYAKLSLNKDLADRIIFEITESNTIKDFETVNHFIQVLKGDGYKVCLDDFGVGSASFQYLHKLHVDYVKVDGSYTRKILTSDRDAIMVKNLAQMCKDLKTIVIAEMVESPAQAALLQSLGIEYGQGYLFGKPSGKPEYTPTP
jgi:PAS domain S-box-containing protein